MIVGTPFYMLIGRAFKPRDGAFRVRGKRELLSMNQAEASQLLSVNTRTIRRWMKEVPPIPFTIISGTEVEYDGTAIVQWFKTHQIESFKKANEISDKRQAQLKDLKARASLLEIELTKVQAELVSAKEVAKEWLAETRVLEDKLSALASKLATVDSSKSYQERKDAYQSIVDALLDDLAN